MLESVAHVQRAGYVRAGQHDTVGRSYPCFSGCPIGHGFEIAGGFPTRIPAVFDGAGIKAFFEFHGYGRGGRKIGNYNGRCGRKQRQYRGYVPEAVARDEAKLMHGRVKREADQSPNNRDSSA